ncbi:uncharacterized protein F5147DRAFT_746218 [Suillus discolor]|uniref:Uncharacterized protein n=1 Tax=Suillus discolor TaxID=1912936 RepID=A0A9P7F457_9AGAM|nr:uncharacterized protein F5147DRAFT_746218 [Suillus discolor]KAG2106796.1 hypothetical protein F5147DRAFT_746218 [Suillus discolor]
MSLTVESVTTQEEACRLRSFDSDVAWEIGHIIRANVQKKFTRPVVIYIAHANSSQLLFFATSGPGTLPDNMHWGCSTMRMRLSLQTKTKTLQEVYEMSDPSIYAVHGGGFPVKVEGVEGVVGVIVVSGLAQEDDHSVIVDGIQEYLAKNL